MRASLCVGPGCGISTATDLNNIYECRISLTVVTPWCWIWVGASECHIDLNNLCVLDPVEVVSPTLTSAFCVVVSPVFKLFYAV